MVKLPLLSVMFALLSAGFHVVPAIRREPQDDRPYRHSNELDASALDPVR
jgi:hypothetical protein